MAVPVQSNTLPQPAMTVFTPESSSGTAGQGDAPQPAPDRARTSAFTAFHPMKNSMMKKGSIRDALKHYSPAIAGVGAAGALAGGIQYMRNKYKEQRRKERDALWRDEIRERMLGNA